MLGKIFCERKGLTPYHVILGRAPQSRFDALASPYRETRRMGFLDPVPLRLEIQGTVATQDVFYR